MKNLTKIIAFSLLFVFCATTGIFSNNVLAASGKIIYVASDGSSLNDGNSWNKATTITKAINDATSGTKIYLKEGNYNLSNTYNLTKEITIYGGFDGTETRELDRVKTDLDNNGIIEPWEFTNKTILTSAKTIFTGLNDADIEIDGLEFTSTVNGNILKLNKGNIVKNSIIKNSPGNNKYGVIMIDGGTLESSYIHNNGSTSTVRGTINVYYNNNYKTIIRNNRIENNIAQYGGGIYSRVGNNKEVSIINNVISNNTASYRGGGIYIGAGSNMPANGIIINNTIIGNTITNSVYNEGSDGDGTGIFAEGGIYLYNNVITKNVGPASSKQIANSLKGGNWHLENNAILNFKDTVMEVNTSNISGTVINSNNISLDGTEKLFENLNTYKLGSKSMLINKGNKTKYPNYVVNSAVLKDLKDDTRVQDGQIDIGAYEYNSAARDPKISLDDVKIAYDGLSKNLVATTSPSGLPVTYTYQSGTKAPTTLTPKEIGIYTVTAKVDTTYNDIKYFGTKTATLEIADVHTINITNDLNGTISPKTGTKVLNGENQTFLITPNEGYEIDKILIDGKEVPLTGNTITLRNVIKNHTISVTFKKKIYTVNFDTNSNSIINNQNVKHGDKLTNIIEPVKENMRFIGWYNKGILYDFNLPVTTNMTLEAKYIEYLYPLLESDNIEIIKNKSGDFTFRIEGNINDFISILHNGKTLNPKEYTVKSGSVIFTFKSEYLNSLSIGKHNFKILMKDGYSNIDIIVKEEITNPKTGDTIINNIILFVISLIATCITLVNRNKILKR